MLLVWLKQGLLSFPHFGPDTGMCGQLRHTFGCGKNTKKIETGFCGFTADQFKNWITIFLISALFGVLSGQYLEYWRHFVIACKILCKHTVSVNDITLAYALLMQFCKRVRRVSSNPNMHMHAH